MIPAASNKCSWEILKCKVQKVPDKLHVINFPMQYPSMHVNAEVTVCPPVFNGTNS